MALNDKDVDKLVEVFASREEIKELVKPLATQASVVDLQKSVDTYAKKADTYFQEMAALGAKVDRLEKNLEKVAKKVGINLD